MNSYEKAVAKKALRNVLIAQALKLVLIIGIARSLKRAVEREKASRNG